MFWCSYMVVFVILLCRVGLFTPDMAFEVIVKNQIRKLLDPSIKCIDMVMTELLDMIKQCGNLVCCVLLCSNILMLSVVYIIYSNVLVYTILPHFREFK